MLITYVFQVKNEKYQNIDHRYEIDIESWQHFDS